MENKNLLGHHGFSLIEIMVAFFIVIGILIGVPMGTGESIREKLETSIDNFDRAVRFASNESILRNSIVRIKVDLNEEPVKYSIQYGPSGNFVIPGDQDTSKMSTRELEEYEKNRSAVDEQFLNVEEFKETDATLSAGVTILGLGSSYQKVIKRTGILGIYFYPTGERDDAMVFFSTDDELAYLAIPAFEQNTKVNYYQYTEYDQTNMELAQENKMKEFYEEWLKD